MSHFADRKKEAQEMKGSGPATLRAGLDPHSCPCPARLPRRLVAQVPCLRVRTPEIDSRLSVLFSSLLGFLFPSWFLLPGRGAQDRLWKNRLLEWEPREAASPPPSLCFWPVFPEGGSGFPEVPRAQGPGQVEAGLAQVSVPPGASCRHFSLPAQQTWALGS